MKYNRLGNTGLLVSEICLGTMTFGGKGFWTAVGSLDQSVADTLVARALDAGVNFLDTADVYSEGLSEEITGKAMRNSGRARTDIVLATKVMGAVGKGVNDRGASRGHIMDGVKASLKRLGTDYIDLYQIHGFDPLTPIEETVRALDDLVRQGHVRYVGVSNWAAWTTMKALGIADRHGWARFSSLQAYYTIAGRDLERELVPMMQAEGLGLLVWSPLAGGLLSGKYKPGELAEGRVKSVAETGRFDRLTDRNWAIVETLERVAQAIGRPMAQVAVNWVATRPAVGSVILGATRGEQLGETLGALDFVIPPDQLAELDAVSANPKLFPYRFLERMQPMLQPR
jgi:aryl-alcohol dehydrogenase-like predicted oxidoreductase